MFDDLELIKVAGFGGFVEIKDLRSSKLRTVPDKMGIYLVLRTSAKPPVFLEESPAGHLNGEDPTVTVEKLRTNWVDNTIVLYIGKAGGPGLDANLFTRLRDYLSFGAGNKAPHRGGRLIWQIANSEDLILCWKETPNDDPEDVETDLIAEFKSKHAGRRPFANLRK